MGLCPILQQFQSHKVMVKNLGTGYTTVERDKDSAANYMCAVIQTHPHKGTHSLCSFQAESLRLSVWTREHRPSNQPGLPKILYSLIKCSRTVPLIAAQLLLLYTQAWFLTLVGFVWSHVTNIHWQFDIFITMNIVIHTTSWGTKLIPSHKENTLLCLLPILRIQDVWLMGNFN